MSAAAEQADMGEKFTSDSALKNGPVTNRGCTDIICLIIFIAHIVAFWVLSFLYAGQDAANPRHLYKPRDYKGDYCSVDGHESHDYMIFTLNVTASIDPIAEAALCSPGWSAYQTVLQAANVTEAQYTAACPSSSGASVDDAISSLSQYTTFEGVTSLLSSSNSILSSITQYFYRVCVTQCALDFATDSSGEYVGVAGGRSFTYSPDASQPWYSVWNAVITADPSGSLATAFVLEALPQSSCPYDAKYCVPLPGVTFTSLVDSYCTFHVDSGLLTTISSATASTYDAIASSSIASDIQGGIGEAFSAVLTTWDVTILVSIISFALGLVFLVLLRFFIKPMVYLAVVLVLLLFIIGGGVMYLYHSLCLDENLDASALTSTSADCLEYKVSSEDGRTALLYSAYVAWVLGAVYALIIVCIFNRIRLAVNINAVAAQFVYETPHAVGVPIIQGVITLIWTMIWLLMVTFLLSQVPDDYVDTSTSRSTYDQAYAACVDGYWPEGGVYMNSDGTWQCYLPRYVLDYRFWYSLFSFFWHNAFFVAVGQCTLAGAVGVWFFNKGERGSTAQSLLSICIGVKNCFRYHLGSLAFGSFIIAVIQTVRWFMMYLEKQSKAQGNRVMEIICKIFASCLWCFEKSAKFLNKNAYIQVALMGTNFCKSAREAFFLILRNAIRFGVLGTLGAVVHFIGKCLIMVATGFIGLLLLEELEGDNASVPWVCVVLYCLIGYTMGVLFMNVFGLAVDATLQCFIAVEEMGIDSSFIPAKLRKFVDDHQSSGENETSKHEGCCSCCHGCCF